MDRTEIGLLLVCLLCVPTRVRGQVNVAINKTYNQISKWDGQGPSSNAANGNTRGHAYFNKNNCIHTDFNVSDSNRPVPWNTYHWWEVDLGRTYPVRDITIWGRAQFVHRLYPFTITVDGQTCVSVASAPQTGRRYNSVTCSSVMYGRVVRLTYTRTDEMMNLCEFQIFVPSGVSQCPAGHHGAQCGQTCSDNCGGGPGNNFCYQDTGVCYDGCTGHFADDFCTECLDGYYKQNSTLCTECTWQCLNNTVCSNTTGDCADCPPGKTGNRCQQECEAGLYGEKCSRTCGHCEVNTTCHHEDGHCPVGCVAEFTGPLCLQEANSWVGPIVGAIIGVGLLLTVSITAAICWRRTSDSSSGNGKNPPTASPISMNDLAPTASPELSPLRQSSSNEDNLFSEIQDPDDICEIIDMRSNYDRVNPYSFDGGERVPYMQLP